MKAAWDELSKQVEDTIAQQLELLNNGAIADQELAIRKIEVLVKMLAVFRL